MLSGVFPVGKKENFKLDSGIKLIGLICLILKVLYLKDAVMGTVNTPL